MRKMTGKYLYTTIASRMKENKEDTPTHHCCGQLLVFCNHYCYCNYFVLPLPSLFSPLCISSSPLSLPLLSRFIIIIIIIIIMITTITLYHYLSNSPISLPITIIPKFFYTNYHYHYPISLIIIVLLLPKKICTAQTFHGL